MHPVLKRILVNGGLSAGILVLVGLLFAQLANSWVANNTGRPGSAGLNTQLPTSLYYRIPLTLAVGGFLFVAVGELVTHRLRRNKPAAAAAKPAASQPDDVEKLLNELLAQAEARMAAEKAAEAGGKEPGSRSQEAGDGGGPPATGVQKPEDREKTEDKKQEVVHGEKNAEESAKPEAEKPGAPPA
jgi:hypothetical protein